MTDHPRIETRKNIRLKGYDYSCPGYYFLTICSHRKRHVFGCVRSGVYAYVELFPLGKIVDDTMWSLHKLFPGVEIDTAITMPNHVHILMELKEGGENLSIPKIMNAFKSIATRNARASCLSSEEALWQRNYFEHVVRSDRALERLRTYIGENPERWLACSFDEDGEFLEKLNLGGEKDRVKVTG